MDPQIPVLALLVVADAVRQSCMLWNMGLQFPFAVMWHAAKPRPKGA